MVIHMITGSKELIRDINRNLILKTIIQEDPISRASLAQHTGLTKATVSTIVADLIEQKLILEIGSDNTSLGRKPILLTFHANCGHTISLDLNHTTISVLVSNLRGENCSLSLHKHVIDRSSILAYLEDIIKNTIATLPDSPYGVIGIGIGVHGTVYDNQVLFAPYTPYEGLSFKEYLENIFHIPVFLDNEANLSVIGEQTFCYNVPNIIGVSVHSGIGAGAIIQSNLYTGINGNAGEFGHTIIERNGRPCPCGNLGCLEQYASERAILEEYIHTTSSASTLEDFITAYFNKDTTAVFLIQEFVSYMAIAINNLSATFNPDVIVINSSFIIHIPDLLSSIQKQLSSRLNMNCTVVSSRLQDTSILLGASCICIKNFLGIDHLFLKKEGSI
ncbi:MAG: ROK family transcriptional regulator [Eubacteriales bacterium]